MSLRRNIAALQLLQLSGVAIPLLTLPWIARALGPEQFGRYSFYIALIAYFTLFTEFGFSWTATREIAIHRDDKGHVSRIACETYGAKALLVSISLIAMTMIIIGLGFSREISPLAFGALSVVGVALAPTWYFQALERPYITVAIDISVRLVAIPVLLLFVRSPNDLNWALSTTAGSQMCIGLIGMVCLLRMGEIRWALPQFISIVRVLQKAFPIFLSTSVVSLYTTTTTVVVGVLANREQLGFFSAAQKILNAMCGVLAPIGQAAYPRVAQSFRTDVMQGRSLVFKLLLVIAPLGCLISCAMVFMAPQIVEVLFGDQYKPAVRILRYLSPVPAMLAFAVVFANLVILPLGHYSKHLLIVGLAAAAHVLVVVPLVSNYGAAGAALAVNIAEFVVFVCSTFYGLKLIKGMKASKL
jgi:PST family polysaccharide transporter